MLMEGGVYVNVTIIFLAFNDLSIAWTKTKYIKLNTKAQNIFCCLNENLTTFLYTLSLTEATRKQSVYISRMLLKK